MACPVPPPRETMLADCVTNDWVPGCCATAAPCAPFASPGASPRRAPWWSRRWPHRKPLSRVWRSAA
eukprot:scaffold144297_cov130-Phaeocystis_antarctica.AAC.1